MPEPPEDEQTTSKPPGFGASIGNVVAVTVHGADVHLYTVTEDQLDNLASGRWMIYTNLASAFFGSLVSLATIFLAGFSSPSPIHTTITAGAILASGILFLFFGTMALFAYRSHSRGVSLIKERRYLA